eukprot:scaffold3614_cov123-Isochrysis_galbana.AAC.13
MAYSVRGAMECTRLSLEAERQSLGPPDLQLQAMLQWAVGSNGGCSDSQRGLCCTHPKSRSSGQWTGNRQSASSAAVRCASSGRAPGYRAGA